MLEVEMYVERRDGFGGDAKMKKNRLLVDEKLRWLEQDIERRCKGFTQRVRPLPLPIPQNPQSSDFPSKPHSKLLSLSTQQISLTIPPSSSPQPLTKQIDRKDELIYIYQNMLTKIINVINGSIPDSCCGTEGLGVIGEIHEYKYENVERVLEETVARLEGMLDMVVEYEEVRGELERRGEELQRVLDLRESRVKEVEVDEEGREELFRISENEDEENRDSDILTTQTPTSTNQSQPLSLFQPKYPTPS